MSELKKPTIEGLVEKLLEGNHIDENEAVTIQTLLEQASNGLNKEEIFTLVTKLNDKLDAHTSDLITPNGLNYASFDSVVKTVSQVIKKEKIQRETRQAQANVNPLQEKITDEKTPQEKAEMERQERIEKNFKNLKRIIDKIPNANELGILDEDLIEIAEIQDINDSIWNDIEEYMQKEKCTFEDAQEKIAQKYNLPPNYFTSNGYEAAEYAHVIDAVEQLDGEEVDIKSITTNRRIAKIIEGKPEIDAITKGGMVSKKDLLTYFIGRLGKCLKSFSLEKEEEILKHIDAEEAILRDHTYGKYENNVRKLKLHLDNLENAKTELANRKNIIEREKIKSNKEKIFFKNMTNLYLSSNSKTTLSKLYEKHKENPKLKEVSFEEFLIEIEENLKSDITNYSDLWDIEKLIKAERTFRKTELLEGLITEARKNGNRITEETYLEEVKKEETNARKIADNMKAKFALKRGIETGKDIIKDDKRHIKFFSEISLETDLEKISNDRIQILVMSKRLGISTDQAAKKYFEENKENLYTYTKRERDVLTGNLRAVDKNGKISTVLKQLRGFMSERNDRLISLYVSETDELSKKLAMITNTDSKKTDKMLNELLKLRKKIKKAEERKEKLEKKQNKFRTKDVVSVLERKEKMANEKEIFANYIQSGKSAMEFLEELNSNKENCAIDKESLLRIICDNARKYLTPEELGIFIDNERTIFNNKKLIGVLKEKIEIAQGFNAVSNAEFYKNKVTKIEGNQKKLFESTGKSREKLLKRMGLVTENSENNNINKTGREEYSVDQTENKMETVELQKKLTVEQLDIDGVKPNVKAIAKKGKVTISRVKKVFAKIVGLRKAKEKEAEQTEQETITEEKTTNTSTETGGR